MSHPTDRIALFNRDMEPLPELTANEVFSRVRSEELNGEHSLTIETTRRLQEGWRALTRDADGKWHEWVVTEIDEEHASGAHAIGTYHFVWSLQYDLTLSYYHDMDEAVSIGIGHRCTSRAAAEHVLTGVANWTVGTCDAPDIVPGEPVYSADGLTPKNSNKINTRGRVKGNSDATGCVFIRESAWSKLSKLVQCAFYEVDAEIEVSAVGNVTARRLCLRDHLGNTEALRRFDWSEDLTGIKRRPDPGPYYCRVVPLGKTQEEYADDDVTKFDWPLDITEETGTEENPGPYWIQDDEAAAVFRIKQPDGSYVYPTVAVEYRDEDDPELLLRAAELDLHNHTRPGVTYEASVLQLSQAGMDVHSVALGDEVQAVDYGFNEDVGLRIEGRVTKIEVDELAPESTMEITIGQLRDNMTDFLHSMNTEMDETFDQLLAQHSELAETLMQMTTANYVEELLDRINAEISGTGGYSYIVPGEGFITYDRAVTDPLVGSEATRVVQLKGGYLRIADTKKTPFGGIDDWDFKTILDAGHIVSDLVTTVKIVAGYIGNVNGNNYWDLDNDTLVVKDGTILASVIKGGTFTAGGVNNGNGIIQVLDESNHVIGRFDKDGLMAQGNIQMVAQGNTSTAKYYAELSSFTVTDTTGRINGNINEQTLYGFHTYGKGFAYNSDLYLVSATPDSNYFEDFSEIIASNGIKLVPSVKGTNSNTLLELDKFEATLIGGTSTNWQALMLGGGPITFRTTTSNVTLDVVKINGGSSSGSMTVVGPVNATAFNNTSDRRLKEHKAYLGDEAIDFVRSLKPANFELDGKNGVGFYAQDVEESDPWGDVFVGEVENDELGTAKTLNYSALIAPLVSYCQSLEKKVEDLEQRIAALESRL